MNFFYYRRNLPKDDSDKGLKCYEYRNKELLGMPWDIIWNLINYVHGAICLL